MRKEKVIALMQNSRMMKMDFCMLSKVQTCKKSSKESIKMIYENQNYVLEHKKVHNVNE